MTEEMAEMSERLGATLGFSGSGWARCWAADVSRGSLARSLGRLAVSLWDGEDGQDLVEYTLLLAFVALAGAAIYLGVSPLTGSLWSVANSRLTSASN